MARPKKQIDPEQVKQLAMIQCSYEEMAAVLQCDPKTLSNRFSQAIKEGREVGKSSLKRAQYKAAMNGNPTMLIWLGKQQLGQRDEQVLRGAGENGEFKLLIEIADENNITPEAGNRISQYITL